MKNITFINAGAGSGKTYRLTQELYKAVNYSECKAHEVMLTTFTKKAAEEIRVKARGKLLKEGKFNEANNLQSAHIGTVHAVGQQIIQKFWHYIGFPKEIRVMDEDDTKFYFTQAIAEVPSVEQLNRLTELNYRFNAQGKFGFDSEKWKSDLLNIIEQSRTNHITNFENSKENSVAYAKKVLNTKGGSINYDALITTIDKIVKISNELPEKGNGDRKKKVKELMSFNSNNIQYAQLKKIKVVIDDFLKKGFIGDEVSSVSNQLEDYHRSKTLIKDIEEYNALLFDIAEKSVEKYASYKQEIGLIDFADMESGFLALLDIPDVKEEIKNTIKLVMVDEFQDSSPIQLAIFIKLSEIVDRSIWVGDPKQSIYGFRGTDPVLIDAIVKRFDENLNESLSTDNLPDSWRSRPEIVDCVNKIFTPALKNQVKEANIALNPVRTDQGFEKTALHHFNFVETKESKKGDVPDTSNPTYYKAIAKSVVKLLKEQWTVSDKHQSEPNKDSSIEKVVTKPLKAKDIAILCKANDTVNAIAQELNKLGVKVSSESNDLKITAEYYLVIALVKLLLSQDNVLAKAEVKVLTEVNYSVTDLIDERLDFINKLPKYPSKPVEGDNINNYKQELETYRNEVKIYYEKLNSWGSNNLSIKGISSIINDLKELPVPQLIEHLAHRLNLYNLVAKWGNSEQRQSNIQKIIEYASKYDERCINMNLGASPLGFINYLQSQDSLTESKAESDDAVNILTYHKSKGLEWPIVILADLQKDIDWNFIARNMFGVFIENKPEVNLDDILGDRTILSLPWAFGAQRSISDDFNTYIQDTDEYKLAKSNHDNEHKRIMYVGMTRARDFMITTAMSGKKKFSWMATLNKHDNWEFQTAADVESGQANVFGRGIDFQVHKLGLPDGETLETKESNKYFAGKVINSERNSEPYFISPSKTSFDGTVEVSLFADIQNRIPTGLSAKDKEAILGNCLHDILYLYIGNKLNKSASDSLNATQKIINNYQMQAIINNEEVLNSIDTLFKYISKTFNPVKWHRELPLECEIEGQLYKGEADLVLETEEGYVLIDYKSYPGSIDKVLDNATSNTVYAGKYAGQLSTYSKMITSITSKKVIKQLIYYTVLGKLVELKT